MITILNPVVTLKGKLTKAADNKFVQGTVKETLASKGINQRTERACPKPEDLEEDTLDTVLDGKTLREIISTLPFTFQFNRNLKPEDWKDIDQVLQLHQLLKALFQWRMANKRFNLESDWAELGASCQKICLKEIDFKDLLVITKGWNPTRQFKLLEVRTNRIRENKSTIQGIEEHLTQTGHTQIPSGSQGECQISSSVASHHSETNRSVAKNHHSSQSQEVSRRRKGYKGKNKTTFSHRKRVRPTDPEAVAFGERSAQEQEVVVNNYRNSSPISRNITPTQIEHNVVTPESNLNSDELWLQLSKYAEKTQKHFAELEASHERMKILIDSLEEIV
ncbi:hypothetical protein O181_017400 [Austropuccinia psidii MF-1]|uniref:Uncharacterized protein n=1 Tax=Austropuccinia psidii MF-1 TaxID=1389203 RepID=A0A9Q3GSZ5_9BASI|nr:hypothetical protein [Austropuccinia psidii MF-1]